MIYQSVQIARSSFFFIISNVFINALLSHIEMDSFVNVLIILKSACRSNCQRCKNLSICSRCQNTFSFLQTSEGITMCRKSNDCPVGSVNRFGISLPCKDINCLICDEINLSKCFDCRDKYLFNFECVDPCPDGYFSEINYRKCESMLISNHRMRFKLQKMYK